MKKWVFGIGALLLSNLSVLVAVMFCSLADTKFEASIFDWAVAVTLDIAMFVASFLLLRAALNEGRK